jgi:tRNA A37 N6-isopentenylltransferase MiaA
MSEQAPGCEAKQELSRLLNDILADLESALSNARNKPAKKLLQERIDRLRRAIEVMAALEQPSRSTADTRDAGRRFGT